MITALTERFADVLPGGASGMAALMLMFGLFILISWLLCIAAAFAHVREVKFTTGVISMGAATFFTVIFMGLTRTFLPDLAASFTQGGLFLVCATMGSLVGAVPLVQFFWDLNYLKSVSVVSGAFVFLVIGVVIVNAVMYPVNTLPARFSVPLVQDHQPWLK